MNHSFSAPSPRWFLAALVLLSSFSLPIMSRGANPAAAASRTVEVNGRTYDAYIEAAMKEGPFFSYTCEFDASWVVLKTFGHNVDLEEQVEIIGVDETIEPYFEQTADGVLIHGGDVTRLYSGNYKENFLARTTGQAMRKIFDHFELDVKPVKTRRQLERALLDGQLIWIKTTVDFKEWAPATWVMPDGDTYETVLGNDHAVVVVGFNDDVVAIRDPLGPTSTDWERPYEYEVDWETFMWAWGAQGNDGLAVGLPEDEEEEQ